MIVGQELREWVGDPEQQRRTQSGVDEFGKRWSDGHVHRRLTGTMMNLCPTSAESIVEAVRKLFSDDGWAEAVLSSLSDEMGDNSFFVPSFPSFHSEIHTGLVVFQDENCSIAAGVTSVFQLAAKKNLSRDAVSIGFTGQINILKAVNAGNAFLSFWEAPPITDTFVAAKAGHCVRTGGRHLVDGEILVIDGRFQSYVIEHADSDLVLLQASVKRDQAPLSVEYHAHTHEYVGCSATEDGASRIQMMTTLLRKMGCDEAFPVMAELLDDPNFFVRWHVMRELLGLDAVAAMPHLYRLAKSDPHPDVRRAALSVLDGLIVQHPGLAEKKSCRA